MPPQELIARIVTCVQRADSLTATLEQLRASDWGDEPKIHMSASRGVRMDRITATWRAALEAAAGGGAVSLILEDDVALNRHLRRNLERWEPIGRPDLFGSLYNAARPRQLASGRAFHAVEACEMWGAQGIVVSPSMAEHILAHWHDEPGCSDTRMPRLAARLAPVYQHVPSLVQHVGARSTWGGPFHQTDDFDADWRAP